MSIYLDAAATTKPDLKVVEAMMPYFTDKWYNPSSLYTPSVQIKRDIEEARKTIADYIGAKSNEIFFTSGGSEGNCWAIQGFVNYWRSKGKTPVIITSVVEHKSITSCVKNLDVEVHYIGVDSEGFIDISVLKNILFDLETYNEKALVSIQYANNEIGTIQRVKEIADIVHEYGATFHADAVQAFGNVDIDVNKLGIDMMTASGHKIGAPKGIGFLYKRTGIDINPLIYGSQMDSMRGGTENVPYIIGMAEAVKLLQKDEEYRLRLTILRNNFISQLKALGCKVNGSLGERLPNNINVTFPQNITGESLLYLLDTSNIFISTGSACNSKSIEPSYVLTAIGLTDEEAMRTIRITLPKDITMDEINSVVNEIKKQIKLLTTEDEI